MSDLPSDAPPARARPRRGIVIAVVLGVVGVLVVIAVVLTANDDEPSGCDDYASLIERIDAGEQEGQSEETISDLGAIALRSEESSDPQVSEAAEALSISVTGFQAEGGSLTLPQAISDLAGACGVDPSSIFAPADL